MIRTIKILLSLSIALLCLFYALQNVVNLDQAYGAVAYVMSNTDHVAYPDSFGPSISGGALVWLALGIILVGEFGAGLVTLKGTWDLFAARAASSAEFADAKQWTMAGAGIAMLVWFGLFHVMGGALFQQWQTEIGDGSLHGAAWLAGLIGLIALYIQIIDD